MHQTLLTTVLLALQVCCSAAGLALASEGRTSNRGESGRSDVINIAFSDDGIHFHQRSEPFIVGGAAPTLAVLPNGDLLAVADYYTNNSSNTDPTMSVTRSRDGGRSWSRLQPVMLFMPKMVPLQAQHGALVTLADGRVALYFVQHVEPRGPLHGKKRRTAILRAAISRKGLRYRLLNDVNIPIRESSYITGWRHHGAVHLALDSLSATRRRKRSSKPTGEQFISRDGEHFARFLAAKIDGAHFVGSVVSTQKELLGYFTSKNNIRAFSSKSGRNWRASDLELTEPARNPAVVRLTDGQFVMLSMAPASQKTGDHNHLVDSAYVDTYQQDRTEPMAANNDGYPLSKASSDKKKNASATSAADDNNQDHKQDATLVLLNGQGDVDEVYADTAALLAPFYEDIGFAPLPNWQEKIDYLAWYDNVLLEATFDNAYDEYAKFIPGESDPEPDWLYDASMFNTTEEVEIGPWDPKQHPAWEKSNRKEQDLLRQFRAAAEHDGYAAPTVSGDELVPGDPDSANLLIGTMLPSLSYHRLLTKMSLADAWREENGKVSTVKMLEAFRVTLQNARHIQKGASLVEELVSGSQRALIYKNARAALKHHVFDDTELISVRNVLRRYDPGAKDPMYSIRGEHAFAMDTTQYIFEPDGPEGKLRAVPERAKMASDLSMNSGEEQVTRIAEMTESDIYKTIDMFDNYYRELGELMRIGYPSVRAEDIDAVTKDALHTSPLAEVFLPALGRYYKLITRIETSRRATQLVYEVHVYRSRNGHWPASLDDLPSEVVEDIRTDPFSGEDFGYRVTPDGPTIYSFSDNGVDDGGIHSRRWGDDITNHAGSDDYVFWPVQPNS